MLEFLGSLMILGSLVMFGMILAKFYGKIGFALIVPPLVYMARNGIISPFWSAIIVIISLLMIYRVGFNE